MSPRTADRNIPAVSSPLSSRTDPMAIPAQSRRRPALNPRQSSNVGPAAHLRLPSLPRFHPANFASANSSTAVTPITGPNSPCTPASPRSNNRQYEVQRQMYLYQQQLLTNTSRQARGPGSKPTSPRLEPLASPGGAVTPLELEGADGYLTARVRSGDTASHVENMIREEAKRRGDYSHGRATPVYSR